MKVTQENFQDSNDSKINYFKISLSLIVIMTNITFLVASIF
jgi:hypothetical protein